MDQEQLTVNFDVPPRASASALGIGKAVLNGSVATS
jgi:hypothetical protein